MQCLLQNSIKFKSDVFATHLCGWREEAKIFELSTIYVKETTEKEMFFFHNI